MRGVSPHRRSKVLDRDHRQSKPLLVEDALRLHRQLAHQPFFLGRQVWHLREHCKAGSRKTCSRMRPTGMQPGQGYAAGGTVGHTLHKGLPTMYARH
jgi:hypothetical protein